MRRRLTVWVAVFVLGIAATALVAPATASAELKKYPCASGFLDVGGSGPFSLGLGQSVDTVVKNNNIFGLAVTVHEDFFNYNEGFVILPGQSHTFSAPAVFGAEPIGYRYSLSTPSSSIVASFTFRSYFCGKETGQIRSGLNNKCMNLKGNGTADGTKITIDTCASGADRQQFSWGFTPGTNGYDGTIHINGKCVDNSGSRSTNGNPVQLWTCNGTAAQKWYNQADGTLRNAGVGKCITDRNAGPDGTQLVIWDCNQQDQQKWTLPVSTVLL
jgi:hypothetical protein